MTDQPSLVSAFMMVGVAAFLVGASGGMVLARHLLLDLVRGVVREFELTHDPSRWTVRARGEDMLAKIEGRPARVGLVKGTWWRMHPGTDVVLGDGEEFDD